MNGAQAKFLNDGRLHLHHGPIDLIITVDGSDCDKAYNAAIARFENLLEELVEELPQLREACILGRVFEGAVARRMQKASQQFLPKFITPMAGVAGSVSDEILEIIKQTGNYNKIHVNNGGDIAFHIGDGQTVKAAIASRIHAVLKVRACDNYRGIATSGWGGRSQSLGIGDNVTVIAENAAMADCGATLIANAIDLPDHPAIERKAAREVFPDSDLGDRLVTTGVGMLGSQDIAKALDNGVALAKQYVRQGLIGGALLMLKDEYRQVGIADLNLRQAGELQHA